MLHDIRVVSLTHFLQGPSASQLLGDLGADVIKIEPPVGAFERGWSAPDAYLGGVSVFFLLGNRNVRSVQLDLKDGRCRDALDKLLVSADVLIESFRPGVLDRLGFGYERVREMNPRLIYCSLSGYGSDGPYVDWPGQDVLLQAISGLAAATGRQGQPPTPAGASLVDQHAAVLATMGILAALWNRERTGKGMRVEGNLLSAALDLQIEPLAYHLNDFKGTRSASGVSSMYYKAPYGVFETADGHLCLSLNSLTTLGALFADTWFSEIDEQQSYSRREEVNERVAKYLRERPTSAWLERCGDLKVWSAPVHDYSGVVADAQVRHNESITTFDHPEAGNVRVVGHPIKYDGKRPGVHAVPPALGAHTRIVLTELGYDEQSIDEIVRSSERGTS